VICFAWEASHGTQEFYFERAAITKRLIAEKAFTVVAIEANPVTTVLRHIQVGNRSNARAFGTTVSCRKLIRQALICAFDLNLALIPFLAFARRTPFEIKSKSKNKNTR
jgi:hypothetical protein